MGVVLVLSLLAALGWGTGDVFSRKAALYAPAGLVVIGMTALAAFGLGLGALVIHGPAVFVDGPWHFYALVALMGLTSYAGGQLFYLFGMQRAGVTITAPIIGAVPLIAVTLAVGFGGERPNAQTVVGAIVIVAGIMVVMTDRNRVLR